MSAFCLTGPLPSSARQCRQSNRLRSVRAPCTRATELCLEKHFLCRGKRPDYGPEWTRKRPNGICPITSNRRARPDTTVRRNIRNSGLAETPPDRRVFAVDASDRAFWKSVFFTAQLPHRQRPDPIKPNGITPITSDRRARPTHDCPPKYSRLRDVPPGSRPLVSEDGDRATKRTPTETRRGTVDGVAQERVARGGGIDIKRRRPTIVNRVQHAGRPPLCAARRLMGFRFVRRYIHGGDVHVSAVRDRSLHCFPTKFVGAHKATDLFGETSAA